MIYVLSQETTLPSNLLNLCINVNNQGCKNPRRQVARDTKCVIVPLLFVGPHVETCIVSSFWRLSIWGNLCTRGGGGDNDDNVVKTRTSELELSLAPLAKYHSRGNQCKIYISGTSNNGNGHSN